MAIANNARNVSYGKPKYGGVAYRAPIDLIPAFVNCAIEAMNPNS